MDSKLKKMDSKLLLQEAITQAIQLNQMAHQGQGTDQVDRIVEAWQMFDNDGNGLLCRHEVTEVLRDFLHLDEWQTNLLFSQVDQNRDEYIDQREFAHLLVIMDKEKSRMGKGNGKGKGRPHRGLFSA